MFAIARIRPVLFYARGVGVGMEQSFLQRSWDVKCHDPIRSADPVFIDSDYAVDRAGGRLWE